jgi:ubiquinone/menaquinone biosynthesis C-methylase UbiE
MSDINLNGKSVLEIGAGDIRHLKYWKGNPAKYVLADVSADMMSYAAKCLKDAAISASELLVKRNEPLDLPDDSIDYIVSFYSLEHLYPLRPYLEDMKRVLKPGGTLIGAIPAEGGLAWGGGAHAHISAVVQEKYPSRSRQDYLLGASQLCRSRYCRAGPTIPATISRSLATAMAASARCQSYYSLSLPQIGSVNEFG